MKAPFTLLVLLFSTPLLAETPSRPVSCDETQKAKIGSQLSSATQALKLHRKKGGMEGDSSALDAIRTPLDTTLSGSSLDCIKKTPKLVSQTLEFAGLVCLDDPYHAGLEYVLELEKAPSFAKALKGLDAQSSKCIREYLVNKKRELKEGNG